MRSMYMPLVLTKTYYASIRLVLNGVVERPLTNAQPFFGCAEPYFGFASAQQQIMVYHHISITTNVAMNLATPAPAETDVLCGQDAKFLQHTGNKLLRDQLEDALEGYMKCADRQEKIAIIDKIIQVMRNNHRARFLRQCEGTGGWKEIDEQSVRDKVSHALRFAARRRKDGGNRTEKPRLVKRKKTTKVHTRKSLPSNISVSTDAESLDSDARKRVLSIHQLQQRILERMFATPDDAQSSEGEEDYMLNASSHSRNSAAEDNAGNKNRGAELDSLEPIPLPMNHRVPPHSYNEFASQPSPSHPFAPTRSGPALQLSSGFSGKGPHANPIREDSFPFTHTCPLRGFQPNSLPRIFEETDNTCRAYFELRTDDHFNIYRPQRSYPFSLPPSHATQFNSSPAPTSNLATWPFRFH